MQGTTRPKQTAFRLSVEGKGLLSALARHLGVSQTAVIELAIRDKAKAEGIRAGAPHETREEAAA